MASYSVLVIGGSGFLGQHVVSLLQSRAPWVTEIRCLDIVPYENKLDHQDRIPVRVFTGSITNQTVVREACRNVDAVIHVATIIDISMIPNIEKTTKINVEGVSTVLKVASETSSVKSFVYSSSVAIHMGRGVSGTNLTEQSPTPDIRYYEPYSSEKLCAERIVKAVNGEDLKTVVIRPSVMYGELDYIFCEQLRIASLLRGWFIGTSPNQNLHQQAYVGNVAWGFICAVEKLKSSTLNNHQIDVDNGNGNRSTTFNDDVISDDAFIIADDNKSMHLFNRHAYFMDNVGIKYICTIPLPVVRFSFLLLYVILKVLEFVGIKLNFPYSKETLNYFRHSFVFSDDKARKLLGYRPIFTPEESDRRSLKYYKSQWLKMTKVTE